MGQILHGSATTTTAVRRAIQNSQESLRALAKRYGINPKTVEKWKKRVSTADRKTGPKAPKSTILTEEEEAIVVAFRRHTLLALDDCLYALQALPTEPRYHPRRRTAGAPARRGEAKTPPSASAAFQSGLRPSLQAALADALTGQDNCR